MKKPGFDNDKYLREQTKAILERVGKFDHKLYLEFGGKLCFDYHASRVLPGYDPCVKMRLLKGMKDKVEFILCIYAKDLENGRIRGDFGVTYDIATLRTIDELKDWGLQVPNVVITRFHNEPRAVQFKEKLERKGITVHTHYKIEDYPADVNKVVSEEGYGKNSYIETKKPIVVVTGPGPGSGKLSTCLSNLYHDHKRKINSGYAKFETFPIWNIPLKHAVNVAYEAATADLKDFNLVDPFHMKTYKKESINYNRDVDAFPLLKNIIEHIVGSGGKMIMYNSPTDMGVNRAGFGIVNDKIVQAAAKQEIIRRYFRHKWEYVVGIENEDTLEHAKAIMASVGLKETDRSTVIPARDAAEEAESKGKGNKGVFCGAAIELKDGSIVTGKNSPLMHAAASAVLNAVKKLANIPDDIHLLPEKVIGNITQLKKNTLGMKSESLDLEEILIALSISATHNPAAEAGMKKLSELGRCDMHMTHIPSQGDEGGLRKLGIHMTTDANSTARGYFLRY